MQLLFYVNTTKVHYLNGGNGLAAIYKETDGVGSLYYAFTDYQGSLIALTDEEGSIATYNDKEQRFAYDPWGNRRDPDDWTSLLSSSDDYLTDRGYTLHEHLSDFSLINMNGRVYDPTIARFLSPDPMLQSPNNALNYNRYTYCMNNPMLYTDPTGMSWVSDAWDWTKKTASDGWDGFWTGMNNSALYLDKIGISVNGGVGFNTAMGMYTEGGGYRQYTSSINSNVDRNVTNAMNSGRESYFQELNATHITVVAGSKYEYTVNNGNSAIQLAKNMGFVSGDITIYDNYVQNQHYIDAGDATVKVDAFANAYLYYANSDLSGGKVKVPIIGAGASVQKGGYILNSNNSFVSQRTGYVDTRLYSNGAGRVLVDIPQLSKGNYRTQLDFGYSGNYAHGGIRGVLDKTFFKKIGGNLNMGGRILVNRAYVGKRIDRLFDNNLERLFWWMNEGVADMQWQLNQY